MLGFPLDEWQEQALEAAMGERADGRWASKFVGMSAPRQNGKSQLIVARALAGVLLFGEKMIIISAHETDTAREVWRRLIDVVEANPSLEARVTGRMNAVNREFLTFGTGFDAQTIKVKARSKTGSRGFSADCLLLDEAQILGKDAWGAIVPTMSARPNPQMWLFGTPPTDTDDPFAFARVREQSMRSMARHCWLEWSAGPDDDIDDPDTWASANPSYGVRVSHEACADDRNALDDQQFRMERLGMWSASAAVRGVIPLDSWDMVADAEAMPVDRFALGVEVGPDGAHASISLAGQLADGRWCVVLEDRRSGSGWVVPYVKMLLDSNPQVRAVVADAGSPSKILLEDFQTAKVKVTTPRVADLGAAHTRMLEGIVTGGVVHTAQPQMRAAVAVATKRTSGDSGLWFFHRASAVADITPIQSATLALLGAQSLNVRKPARSTSGRRVVTY